jgi:hypothetical protein
MFEALRKTRKLWTRHFGDISAASSTFTYPLLEQLLPTLLSSEKPAEQIDIGQSLLLAFWEYLVG